MVNRFQLITGFRSAPLTRRCYCCGRERENITITHAADLPINYLTCPQCSQEGREPEWVGSIRRLVEGDNTHGN